MNTKEALTLGLLLASLLAAMPIAQATSASKCDGPICALADATATYQDNTWPKPNTNTYVCGWHGGSSGAIGGNAQGQGPTDMSLDKCTGTCSFDPGAGCGDSDDHVFLGETSDCGASIKETATATGGYINGLGKPLFVAVAVASADPCSPSTNACDYVMLVTPDGCDALPDLGCLTNTHADSQMASASLGFGGISPCDAIQNPPTLCPEAGDVCTFDPGQTCAAPQSEANSAELAFKIPPIGPAPDPCAIIRSLY
jgi:hypothetical protein